MMKQEDAAKACLANGIVWIDSKFLLMTKDTSVHDIPMGIIFKKRYPINSHLDLFELVYPTLYVEPIERYRGPAIDLNKLKDEWYVISRLNNIYLIKKGDKTMLHGFKNLGTENGIGLNSALNTEIDSLILSSSLN